MRKAQITTYVLLGLVVLFLVLLYLVLGREPSYEQTLPGVFDPVRDHLLACLEETAADALQRMALHGGYLDPLGPGVTFNPVVPTESDLVLLNPGDPESLVPYYLHVAGRDDCTRCAVDTLTPSLDEQERTVEEYVLAHLGECTNLGSFPDVTVTPTGGEESVRVEINEENVLVRYDRDLEFRSGSLVATANRFEQAVPVPYGAYYAAARRITEREIGSQFLENLLMYVIATYGSPDGLLPPIGDYQEGYEPSLWVLHDVRRDYADILSGITPFLRVMGTKDVRIVATGDPDADAFLTTTLLDLGFADERFTVAFEPRGPVYLDVKPRTGQLIRPRVERTGGSGLIPPRHQTYYEFFYDVSAPFLVTIRHEQALPGRDFSFVFALEANLRDTKNVAQWLLGRGTIPWSEDFVEMVVAYEEAYPPEVTPPAETDEPQYRRNESLPGLLCNPSAATVPLAVRARSPDGSPVAGAEFTYECGYYGSCAVGRSDADGLLETLVPQCQGARLSVYADGYLSSVVRLSTRQFEPARLPDVLLEPFVDVDVSFELVDVREEDGLLSLGPPRPLGANDTAFVHFLRRSFSDEEPVSAMAFSGPAFTLSSMRLVPGTYEVEAWYLDAAGVHIPAGCDSVCVERDLFGGCDRRQPLPEEDLNITPAPWGGLELGDETRLFTVTRDDLAKGSLVVPLFVAPPAECLEDLEAMGAVGEYVTRFPQVAPRFS